MEAARAAVSAAYPPGFWNDVEALRAGDETGLEAAIDFLEADPWFFRSGYMKAELIGLIVRRLVSPGHAERLRQVVLDIVARRDGREFRRYCALARHVGDPALRAALDDRRASPDADIRRRAGWVLDALATTPARGRRPI